jgi:phosphonate transport system substrate-binding protein
MSSNLQLIPIRQLELFRDKTALENDGTVDEAAKKQRVAEIDQQLDELAELARITAPATQ